MKQIIFALLTGSLLTLTIWNTTLSADETAAQSTDPDLGEEWSWDKLSETEQAEARDAFAKLFEGIGEGIDAYMKFFYWGEEIPGSSLLPKDDWNFLPDYQPGHSIYQSENAQDKPELPLMSPDLIPPMSSSSEPQRKNFEDIYEPAEYLGGGFFGNLGKGQENVGIGDFKLKGGSEDVKLSDPIITLPEPEPSGENQEETEYRDGPTKENNSDVRLDPQTSGAEKKLVDPEDDEGLISPPGDFPTEGERPPHPLGPGGYASKTNHETGDNTGIFTTLGNVPRPGQTGYILAEDLGIPSLNRVHPGGSNNGRLMKAAEAGANADPFASYDAMQGGGFDMLAAGKNTPTAALDGAPQSRNMAVDTGTLNSSSTGQKGPECEASQT